MKCHTSSRMNFPDFNFSLFLSKPTQVREWNIQGLPTDLFSTENGVIVTRGSRWPLMVDPQAQAIKWVKNMERKEGLTIFDLQTQGYLQQVCVFFFYWKKLLFLANQYNQKTL